MISVVMSIYKTDPQYISQAIESMLRQTYQNFEFLIVNNGACEKVQGLLMGFDDQRIRIISVENVVTLYEARALAISKTENEWIAIMDADDVSESDRLEKQLNYIEKHSDKKIGCVGTWSKYMNEQGDIIGYRKSSPSTFEQHAEMRDQNEAIIITDPSGLLNRAVFLEVGGYNREYSPAADLDLWYRIVEAGYYVISTPEYLFNYRIHKDASSSSNFMLQRKKTHFANLNMESRRTGKDEITYDEFCEFYWSKSSYRLPRMWRNYAKFFYKKAGLNYLEKSYLKMIIHLIVGGIINPIFVIKRILSHKFGYKSL